ncbi:HU family DNA-binding protein [Botrimarina hoheduenensis]|uniref:DNA-binding protein HU n=1 Tax=Botrimarina hoheduenensis TaxID=2528000 RepID=A0A5C5WG04_9BACT|nr:HU family DNA-binding protein [Botrimarina hoheduenensis]TWT48702.1 DNA-binding protein HU [Botrimarina hoheduenensis]
MTKKEIVRTISEEIGLTQLKTKEIVQKTFDAIVETLVEDRRIELRNFGVFEVKKRAARKARNPRTGEKVEVAEKFVVTFKPGKEMEERVRELERRAAEEAAALRAQQAAASNNLSSNEQASYVDADAAQPAPRTTPPDYPGYDRPASDAAMNDSASEHPPGTGL